MSQFDDYRVSSPFGWRQSPTKGGREFHTGIDLVTAHNGAIYAFTDGTVIFAAEGREGSGFGGYGIVVAVKDKNNRLQVYAHLSAVVVKVGQLVTRGQMIGRQGSTGKSTGQHLHYEVRKAAQAAPPYGWQEDKENNCLEPTAYLQEFYPTEARKVKPEDAHKVTDLLGKAYNAAKAAGADQATLQAIGKTADDIRVAAGLPKQN